MKVRIARSGVVDMRGYQLEGAPICSYGMFEGCAGFIVQDMDHGFVVGACQAGMDVLISRNAVSIVLAGKG